MKEVILNIELANALLNYLAGRPYGEVFQLIQAMQAAAQKNESSTEVSEVLE